MKKNKRINFETKSMSFGFVVQKNDNVYSLLDTLEQLIQSAPNCSHMNESIIKITIEDC